MPWSRDEVLKLRDLCKANKDAKDICQILQRSPTALYYTFYSSAFAFFRVCAPSNNDYYRKCMYRLKNEER